MRFRLPHVFLTLAATACALAAPAAHAFTVENKDAAGQYAVPKFDLEEQSKNFRKDGADVVFDAARATSNAARQRHAAIRRDAGTIRPSVSASACRASRLSGAAASRNIASGRSTGSLAPPSSLEYNGTFADALAAPVTRVTPPSPSRAI